ncbi:Hypothetical protein ADU72_1242 [Pediococcus damnosus]|uniref:Uncharacterized protein n=2 Tax=Pediococcus damnosus TaxID=51663 RepID=A0AAC9B1W0_9LACO|nr:Hypothetical protein ADU70_1454 [Pediococcus damnosus]AMV64918.1 Hypothetical protein ADU71_1020 [Pediococcus damnosus]AMV67175.1 Hypothetical protein ADU72_1242 [Pediococcus damnosus]AMV69220.1 Hypothetical protein ADU73_0814 [Pediococcus damnosus]
MGLSETQIKKFIRLINKTVISLKFYPNRFSDITSLYGFSKLTRRILIGKKYAIFYRVNKNQQIVQIGSLVQQKQVKVNF